MRNSYGGSVTLSLSTFRRSRFYVYETCSVFRCSFVPYRIHYPLYIEESMRVLNFALPYLCATGLELRFFDVAILGMV